MKDTPVEDLPRVPTRFRITYADLKLHGFEPNCPQCRHNREYHRSRDGRVHTDRCRERLLRAFNSTEKGRLRIQAYEERLSKAMEEKIRFEAAQSSGMRAEDGDGVDQEGAQKAIHGPENLPGSLLVGRNFFS